MELTVPIGGTLGSTYMKHRPTQMEHAIPRRWNTQSHVDGTRSPT
ncbi:hypothetical protein [Segatella maculosa]|nr:hypothetical protein [Segatella maculosa]